MTNYKKGDWVKLKKRYIIPSEAEVIGIAEYIDPKSNKTTINILNLNHIYLYIPKHHLKKA